jgi:hypothetical protein
MNMTAEPSVLFKPSIAAKVAAHTLTGWPWRSSSWHSSSWDSSSSSSTTAAAGNAVTPTGVDGSGAGKDTVKEAALVSASAGAADTS